MLATAIKPSPAPAAAQASIQHVTPAMAAAWLETMPYEHQRSIRQGWIDYLTEEIRRGNFTQGTTITIAYINDRPVLIDGQHRLRAVVKSDMTQSFIVSEVIARDSDHAAWLYANMDIGLRRTSNDLYKALDLPTEMGMTSTQIENLSAAVSFMTQGLTRQDHKGVRMHRDDLLAGMRAYAPQARQFFEMVGTAGDMRRPCKRAATLAVALLTLRFSAPVLAMRNLPSAVDFWRGVIEDDGIKASDPRKYANRHLLTHQMISGRKMGAIIVTPAKSARILAACFNAYIAGRELAQTPKVLDDMAPINIYGVPRDHVKWLD